MRLIAALALVASLSTGCAATVSEQIVYCPSIPEYDDDFNQQLADDVESLPSDTRITEALNDYARTRDAIRACERNQEDL